MTEVANGSIEQLIRLSKDIPQLVACGLVGDVILGKEVSKAAYTPQNTTPWARDREIKDFFHPLILDTMESIKAVFFKPDPAAQVSRPTESEGRIALTFW